MMMGIYSGGVHLTDNSHDLVFAETASANGGGGGGGRQRAESTVEPVLYSCCCCCSMGVFLLERIFSRGEMEAVAVGKTTFRLDDDLSLGDDSLLVRRRCCMYLLFIRLLFLLLLLLLQGTHSLTHSLSVAYLVRVGVWVRVLTPQTNV